MEPMRAIEAKALTYFHQLLFDDLETLQHYLAGYTERTVLDCGCGGGIVPLFLPGSYRGIDVLTEQVKFARANTGKPFVVGDLARLPFKTKSLEHFICWSVLEHLPDPGRAVREIARVIRIGGLVKVPCRDRIPFFLDPVNALRLKFGKPPVRFGVFDFGNVSFLTTADWRKLLTANGLMITDERDARYTLLMQLSSLILFVLFRNREYHQLPVGRKVSLEAARRLFRLYRLVRWIDPPTPRRLQRLFTVAVRPRPGIC